MKNVRLQPLLSINNNFVLGYEALSAKKQNGEYPTASEMLNNIASEISIEDSSSFFINITPEESSDKDFAVNFIRLLEKFKIDNRRVILEINENSDPNMLEEIKANLKLMHQYGIKIAFDDIGTENATLDFMRLLPVDIIKIDKQFVQSAPNSEKDEAILNFFVDAGHEFGCHVVAEGIETEKQLEIVKRAQADIWQGFLFTVQSACRINNLKTQESSPFIQLNDFSNYISDLQLANYSNKLLNIF